MPWLELRIDASEGQVQALEATLTESGALAVTFADAGDQPILEPDAGTMPLWSEIVLVALFDASIDTAAIERDLRQDQPPSAQNLRWNILEDRVWEREWLKHQTPAKFGDAFWVYHEKIDDPLPTLLLDPGLAFGTGSHPTTALCLEWIATQSWQGKKLVDYGCGSGILAIAALLNGAEQAACVDIDGQALQATRNNAVRNQISEEQLSVYYPNNEPNEAVPVLIANILSGPLVELAPELAGKVIEGGHICLSGVLREQEQDIIAAYELWFTDLSAVYSGDWVRITGQRNSQLVSPRQEVSA